MARWTIVLGALVALTSATAPAQTGSKPFRDADVVARVNGTPIYRKAVREVVQGALRSNKRANGSSGQQLADDALDSLIDFELLYQDSKARGITVNDAAVDDDISRTQRNSRAPTLQPSAQRERHEPRRRAP